MLLKTRVFELAGQKYSNITELAQGMGLSAAQLYRVRRGERKLNEKFIIGAIKAFSGYELSDLFYVAEEGK